jgi:D-3-phosphoglycerate dehydrogenase
MPVARLKMWRGAQHFITPAAALDVFDQEPPPEDHPLFALHNVILTPHSARLSKEAAIRIAISTARNVLAGIDGTLDPSMVVNREVL